MKSQDMLAREIDRLEEAEQRYAMAYSAQRDDRFLRRANAIQQRRRFLEQQYAMRDAEAVIAQHARL